jgi:hypothetical protein
MRFSIIYITLLLFVSNIMSGEMIHLDGTNKAYLFNSAVSSDDGNVLTFFDFNSVDGNIKTCVAVNTNMIYWTAPGEKTAPFFKIILREKIKTDKLVIWNGFQRSTNLFNWNSRIKELYIEVRDYKVFKKKPDYVTNIILKDMLGMQELNLPSAFEGNEWIFSILSTYPGTKYDDICISEMELWYKGEKYEVANLEDAKREYVGLYIQNGKLTLHNANYMDGLKEEKYTNLLKLTDWPYEKPEERSISIRFKDDGKITVGRFYGDSTHSEKYWKETYKLTEIGQWKFDRDGRLWVKVGNEIWKYSKNGVGDLRGTDLECYGIQDRGP